MGPIWKSSSACAITPGAFEAQASSLGHDKVMDGMLIDASQLYECNSCTHHSAVLRWQVNDGNNYRGLMSVADYKSKRTEIIEDTAEKRAKDKADKLKSDDYKELLVQQPHRPSASGRSASCNERRN